MPRTRLVTSLIFASVAFLWGCQEQASGPTGPDGSGPLFTHKGADKPHGKPDGGGGGGGGGTKVTWSEANLSTHGVPTGNNTLQSSCAGFPGTKTSNPSVWWNDEPDGETEGSTDGCAQVTTTDGTLLTNDASLIVATKKGGTEVTVQFQIQDVGGPAGIQYRSDKSVIDAGEEFTGAGFTLHVHRTIEVWKLKGHTGGPKVELVGTIDIGDIVYN